MYRSNGQACNIPSFCMDSPLCLSSSSELDSPSWENLVWGTTRTERLVDRCRDNVAVTGNEVEAEICVVEEPIATGTGERGE